MAKYQNQIEYSITTKLDAKGLTQLQTQIREIEVSLQRLGSKDLNDPFGFSKSAQELSKLNKALSSSFNSSLGVLDLSKLKTELKDAGISAQTLGKAFSQGGAQGKIAMNNLLGQIGKIDTGLKRTSTTVDKMFNTISNTVRWGVVSSGFSAMLNSLHQSVDYVKELDDSLTQIMLVTDYSREQMNEYAKSANKAAKALGATTVDVTRGSQVFAQQGFGIQQSEQLAELSIKLANASEQDSATTSDQITALMNAYDISGDMDALSKALDSWALVANISAADVEELAKASQKAASSASTVGVGLDQMNAQIATIESVTRDAPEQIGNGLKTLYSRMSDIELGETLEDGVDLGKVTTELQKIGVQVLDQAGQMRNVGDIMEDLMVVWDDLDQTSKEAAGQALAGKYQLNRFYALMDNSDMYREYKEGSTGASGTLDQMNQEYLDSMAGRTAKLQAMLEGLFNSVFDPDNFYPAIDALTSFVELINKLIDSLGGGQTVLTGIVALFGKLFSNNISQMISDANYNRQMDNIRKQNAENVPAILSQLGYNEKNLTSDQQNIVDYVQYIQKNQGNMSETQAQNANNVLQESIDALNRYEDAVEKAKQSAQELNMIIGATGELGMQAFEDENGRWNIDGALEEIGKIDDSEIKTIKENLATMHNAFNESESDIMAIKTLGEEFANSSSKDATEIQLSYDKLVNKVEETRNKLEKLRSVIGSDTYNKLVSAIDTVEKKYVELGTSVDAASENGEEAIQIFEELKKVLQTTNTDIKTGVERAARRATSDASDANAAEANIENAGRTRQGVEDTTENQKSTKSILDTVAAIGQLTFAWQGFQNLGSLWANNDISAGEKIIQTIMNLTMTIPSLISAYGMIEDSLPKIMELSTKLTDSVGKGIVVKKADAIASLEESAAENVGIVSKTMASIKIKTLTAETTLYTIAQKAAAGATGFLGAALSALLNPIGLVATGIAVIGGAIANWQIQEKANELEKFKESFQEAENKLNDFNNTVKEVDDFNILYESWKNGTASSEELKNKCLELSESLGDAGLKARASAEDFDGFANTLDKAQQKANDLAQNEIIATSQDVVNSGNDQGLFGLGGVDTAITDARAKSITALNQANLDYNKILEGVSSNDAGSVNRVIEALSNMRAEVDKNTPQYKALTDAMNNFKQVAQDFPTEIQASIALRNAQAELSTFQKTVSETTASTKMLRDVFSQNEDFGAWFGQISYMDQLAFMLEHVTDEGQKANLELAQIFGKVTGGDRATTEWIGESLTSMGMDLEQAFKFSELFDEESTYEDVVAKLTDLGSRIREGTSLDEALERMVSEALKEGAEQGVKNIEETISSMSPVDEDVKAEDFQSLNETFFENKDKMGQEGTPFEDYSPELLNNAEGLAQVTEGMLRYNDAIQTIDKSLEDWKTALNDTNEFSAEQIQAVQELQETYSDFLDLAEGTKVSKEFARNAKNLELMEQAANGVEEAYDELAEAAAEDILIHMDVEDVDSAKETLGELFNLLEDSDFDTLKIGDIIDFDDEQFSGIRDKINQLAIDTGWTAEQMANYLNNIGLNIDPSMFEPVNSGIDSLADNAAGVADFVQGVAESAGSAMEENLSGSTETEIETVTDSHDDQIMYTNLTPQPGPVTTITSTFPVGTGNPTASGIGKIETQTFTAQVRGVQYTAEPVPATQTREQTGFAMTSKFNKGKNGKGGVRLKSSGATGTKGSRGGVGSYKPSIASRPSSSGGSSGGRGASGGSGGGGGGSEKTYEPKTKDPIKEEIDLYEKVNTQLDDVQETLEGIEEEEDRLIGPGARANLNKQLDLLQKEIDLQKQKLEIQKQERNDLASQLSSRFGVTFDSEGFISNYAAVLKQLEQRYNDLVSEYNSATTEESQEELAKAIDEAKENIDKFKDLYQRYDTLQGKEIKETQNDIEKLRDQIEDLRISAYKAAQSAIDDLKDLRDNAAELLGLFTDYKSDSPFRATITDAAKLKNIFGGTKKEAIDYYQTLIDRNQKLADSATDAASKAAYQSQVKFFKRQQKSAAKNPLGTGALGLASQDLARLQQWIDNPNAADNPFGQNTSALYEAYEDAYNRMRSLALEAEQAWEQLEKDIIEGYEEIAEQEEDMSKRFDRLTKNLETLGDVLTLVKGEDEYGDLAKIYQQIGQTTLVQAQQQKEILRAWQDRYNSIEDKTSDIAKTVREQMEAAEDRLIELQKSVVESWQKAFENAIKEITAKENQRLLGVRSIEDTSSDWERDKKYAENYYDDVQKAMAIEQLRLKYMDLLDDAQNSNLDIQNRIRDAMNEQVKYLEDQEHLSEFNVKYANAQLEILQKQIALEDARNNKNQMRLRRDTQGNYRYVYSANQDDVRDKEADLLQTEFDAYNMSNENRMNTYTEWLAYYQNYQQQREAIIQRMEQGDAEAADALKKLEEDFARDMEAYSEELGDSWDGMIGALTWMAETGTETIKESAEIAMQAIRDKTNESLNAVGIQWNETVDGVIENVQELLNENINATDEMVQTAQTYKDTITRDVAPLTTDSFTDINAAVQNAAGSTRDLAQASRELQEALLGDNAQLVEAQQQLEKYRKQLDNVKNSSAITAQQLRRAQEELDRTKAENLNYRTQIDDLQYRIDHPSRDQSGGGSGSGDSGSGGFRVGDMVGFHGQYYYDSLGTTPAGNWYVDQPHAVRIAEWSDVSLGGYQNTGPFTASLVATDGTWLGWVKPEQLFDTGGYTGEWNSNSGRIAMLHQKELVLNQTDTENILNAVNMVRNMADMLKLFTGISSMKGTSYNKLGGDTIEQRVEITAEFPNVQDSNEIEKALLNLADSAYQYSYR